MRPSASNLSEQLDILSTRCFLTRDDQLECLSLSCQKCFAIRGYISYRPDTWLQDTSQQLSQLLIGAHDEGISNREKGHALLQLEFARSIGLGTLVSKAFSQTRVACGSPCFR